MSLTSELCQLFPWFSEYYFSERYGQAFLFVAAAFYLLIDYILQKITSKRQENSWVHKSFLPVIINVFDFEDRSSDYLLVFTSIGFDLAETLWTALGIEVFQTSPTYVKPVILLIICFSTALKYCPVFGALTREHPVTYFYAGFYLMIKIFVETAVRRRFPCFYQIGAHQWLIYMFNTVPIIMVNIYLIVRMFMKCVLWIRMFYSTAKNYSINNSSSSAEFDVHHYQLEYVKELINPNQKKVIQKHRRFRLLRPWRTDTVTSFPYSIGFVGPVAMAFSFLSQKTILLIYYLNDSFSLVRAGFRSLNQGKIINASISFCTHPSCESQIIRFVKGEFFEHFHLFLNCFQLFVYLSIFTSLILCAFALSNSFGVYKRDMNCLYKGMWPHKTFKPARQIAANCLKFMGYQFGFVVGGYGMQVVFFSLLSFPISLLITALMTRRITEILMWPLRYVITPVVCMIGFLEFQLILVRTFFLVSVRKGTRQELVLAIHNMQTFMNFYYMAIFSNSAIGLVTLVKRMIYGIFYGLWTLPRLDQSIFNRCIEAKDNGFAAYIGYLNVQNTLTNPCAVMFVRLLQEAVRGNDLTYYTKKRKRARNRWFLAMTLLNNPWLRVKREWFIEDNKGRSLTLYEMNTLYLRHAIVNSQVVALPGFSIMQTSYRPKKKKTLIPNNCNQTI